MVRVALEVADRLPVVLDVAVIAAVLEPVNVDVGLPAVAEDDCDCEALLLTEGEDDIETCNKKESDGTGALLYLHMYR